MSESRFNRSPFAPSSNAPWSHGVQRDADAPQPVSPLAGPGTLGAFFDEPTVEFDARLLSDMLARSANEPLEETRTFQIPAEVLALARGDGTPAGRTAVRAWASSPLALQLAHVLMTASAIALGYFLVQIIDG